MQAFSADIPEKVGKAVSGLTMMNMVNPEIPLPLRRDGRPCGAQLSGCAEFKTMVR